MNIARMKKDSSNIEQLDRASAQWLQRYVSDARTGSPANPAGVGVEILAIAESASRVIVEVDARCLAVEHVSAIEEILCDRLAARLLRPSFSLTQGTQAYVHCILDSASTGFEQSTLTDIEESIHRVVSGWSGEFATLVSGRNVPISLREHYSQVLPEEYRHEVSPVRAIEDVLRVESLGNGSVDVVLDVANSGAHVLSLYVLGRSIPLSAVLPVLRDLGTDVVDEKHYPVERVDGSQAWIYRFTLTSASARNHAPSSPSLAPRFAEAFLSMWDEAVESDGLGALIVGSELDVRQIAALRAYSHYLRQSGLPYSLARIESVLREHSKIATALIELFEVRHDPAFDAEARSLRAGLLTERIVGSINDVAELDADRILRALLSLIDNTLRTNYFYRDAGVSDPFLALKFDSRIIDVLPYPRPHFEIFVDSPRFEGVHLRFGGAARGGLRWSDRREDFRTEVLGLAKAQSAKNAVIVPVGAKGGFVVKESSARRSGDSPNNEGCDCYRMFVTALLRLTDNVDSVTTAVVPAPGIVRHDGDDYYLVVAPDKGTARFSDLANAVAVQRNFWLGDAFASGGSVGYDHKEMGITARGAWTSVRRHFLERNVDVDRDDFTAVGIGDMSGDVFGNGMLLSRHLRLVAAFDHRHIFLDPNPDPSVSYEERSRLFHLQRSSWADYDRALISTGGGVFDRSAKSIPLTEEVRSVLGISAQIDTLTPAALISRVLTADVDLLWNGGIGTYVKAADESHLQVGDKANDLVRVDSNQLRCSVIGEGGNLGLTQRARIDFSLRGGHVNTDALDNSAGVDCSDHEVNIKILLDSVVKRGELSEDERNSMLASMTDDVANLVLANNRAQNDLLATARAEAIRMADVHQRQIDKLERDFALDRELEFLPSDDEIALRLENHARGLTSPELATLSAHVKLSLKADLLRHDLIEDEHFAGALVEYFPPLLRERFGGHIISHPLAREIVATVIANRVVGNGGLSYVFRLADESGVDVGDAVRAFEVVRAVFGLESIWQRIRGGEITVHVADQLIVESRRLLDRAARWFLSNRPQPLDIASEIARFGKLVSTLSPHVPGWMQEYDRANVAVRSAPAVEAGVDRDVVDEVYGLLDLYGLLDVVEIVVATDQDPRLVGELYFMVKDRLEINRFLMDVSGLDSHDRWDSLVRLTLRDELYESVRLVTLDVLSVSSSCGAVPDASAATRLRSWEERNSAIIGRARYTLSDAHAGRGGNLATLSVAARRIRSLASTVQTVGEPL
ncbi:NAD-glutamate dehydrogenase [Rhodococcus sp. KBS0724]|nr:NAD-glutamate dehydrogenase [Rhodococcus sp. KBS0724]